MEKGQEILLVVISLLAIAIIASPNNITGMVVNDIYNIDYALKNLDKLKEDYNNHSINIPTIIKSIFGNEKVLLTITRIDGSKTKLSLETKKGKIKTLTKTELTDYTLDVLATEKVINEIVDSNDQIARIINALDNNEIVYKSHRIKTSIKLSLSKFFIKIAKMFS